MIFSIDGASKLEYNASRFKKDMCICLSLMDNDILLINFEDDNSIINKSDIIKSTKRCYSKSSSGIGPGAIVAIILCSILALASVIAIIYCSQKNNIKNSGQSKETSSIGVNLNKII